MFLRSGVTNNWGVRVMTPLLMLVAQWFLSPSLDLIQISLLSCSCLPMIHSSFPHYLWFLEFQILTPFYFSWVSKEQILLPFCIFGSTYSLPSSFWSTRSELLCGNHKIHSWESWNLINHIVSQGLFEKYSL